MIFQSVYLRNRPIEIKKRVNQRGDVVFVISTDHPDKKCINNSFDFVFTKEQWEIVCQWFKAEIAGAHSIMYSQ